MEKCYVENLAMIITDRCNLDCTHCLRGKKCNRYMSDEVVESTLSQMRSITECDASIEHQETIYNYGNVLTTSIQESTLGREHTLIKRPAIFRKEAYKEYKRYQTYNK